MRKISDSEPRAALWAAFLILGLGLLGGCANGPTDRLADHVLVQADTTAQRAYRVALYAAPLVEMAYDHSPTARHAACEAAATMHDVRALAESGDGVALALGLASRVILTLASQVPAVAAGGPVTQASTLVGVATALSAIPATASQVSAAKEVLRNAVAAERDPTAAEWDLALAPALDVSGTCSAVGHE